MQYQIRFFLKSTKNSDIDRLCFADVKSEHLPEIGSIIYIGDEIIKEYCDKFKNELGINYSDTYKIVSRVFTYNKYYNLEEHLSSVEFIVEIYKD